MKILERFKKEENSRKIIAMAFIVMAILVFGMYKYVQKSIYDERVVHLKAQTQTTRNLVNKTIGEYSNYADLCARTISDQLQPGDDVYDFLKDIQNILYKQSAELILVDSDCVWYSNKNDNGRITSVNMYTSDTDDKEIYITEEVFSGKQCIICRNRLEKPVEVRTRTGTATIEYSAIICYMEDLESSLRIAFPYDCNRFICNDKGVMLYKDFQMGTLVGGSNIFSKYERLDFLHGVNGNKLIESIKRGNTEIAEFKVGGNHYFVCSSRLRYCGWTLTYVMDTDKIAAGSYVIIITIFLSAMCLVFIATVMLMLRLKLQTDDARKQVELEKKTNEMLEQTSKAKSEFLSNMSHDIRTPINGIVGMINLARREKNTPKTDDCLDKIEGASMHLLTLVNDVLDMSSIESGKISVNRKPADISKLPASCVAMLMGQAEEKGLEIVSEFEPLEAPILMADELKLRQIVLNILGNAIKYTPEGGRIIYRAHEEKGATDNTVDYCFEIEDNGIGMSSEYISHIWESFSQEDGGSRTNFKGTGLGMAITKKFVELMDGSIEVESELDKGSIFRVRIPMEISCEALEETKATSGRRDISGMRILLVEDNELNIEIAEELLTDEGAVVTVAHNGREALDEFSNKPEGSFDVILMDVMMPEMDGLEATRQIRKLDKNDARTIPIVAMSANAYDDDIAASKNAGMNAHLSKPINMEQLLRTIASFFAS